MWIQTCQFFFLIEKHVNTDLPVGPVHYARDPPPRWQPYLHWNDTVQGTHKPLFSTTFLLKMGLTALFTHLKIILLQCFQFSVFNKINCIQTNPNFTTCLCNLIVTRWIWIQEISTYEVWFQECVSWRASSFIIFSKQLSFLKHLSFS